VPGIHAFNFVCTRALDGGGMASLRNDPLGKGMAQVLLCMPVRVAPDLLPPLAADDSQEAGREGGAQVIDEALHGPRHLG